MDASGLDTARGSHAKLEGEGIVKHERRRADPRRDRVGPEVDPLRVAARLKRELTQEAAQRDRDGRFPHAELARLKKSGLPGLNVPRTFGGSGVDAGVLVRVVAQLAEGDPNVAQMFLVHASSLEVIVTSRMAASTKREIFRRVVEEGQMFTNAYSEVGTRTIEDFRARFARERAGTWRFNGRKFYCTGSLGGDLVLIGGLTDDAESAFVIGVVDIDTPGVVVHDDWRGMGQKTTASGTIEFEDVTVPEKSAVPRAVLHAESPHREPRAADVQRDLPRHREGSPSRCVGVRAREGAAVDSQRRRAGG